jgi:hypothetical protein
MFEEDAPESPWGGLDIAKRAALHLMPGSAKWAPISGLASRRATTSYLLGTKYNTYHNWRNFQVFNLLKSTY